MNVIISKLIIFRTFSTLYRTTYFIRIFLFCASYLYLTFPSVPLQCSLFCTRFLQFSVIIGDEEILISTRWILCHVSYVMF